MQIFKSKKKKKLNEALLYKTINIQLVKNFFKNRNRYNFTPKKKKKKKEK